ncbi:MAG: prephenate dehydrogenase [Odoribacter splanchnicus]|nr:prephenate dehydrogenase [Odoribacter splanchnicus]
MQVGVIGIGLIGGSMAIDLKKRGFADRVVGVEADALHAAAAKEIGLVDEVVTYEECVATSDIIVVAVPVSAAIRMIPDILDKVNDRQVVTDVCSTKEKINEIVHYHPNRKNFVAAHPMAGTEYSGPWAALPGLFDGRAGIICNAEDSDNRAVELIKSMYDCLNMRIIFMRAAHHDVHTAYVSHISHITSFALALTVLEKEKNEKNIFDLASGGFSSTVRLAKSNADMWAPIFSQNKENVLTVLDTYIEKLQEFKKRIADYDEEGVKDLIHKANKIKRIIR